MTNILITTFFWGPIFAARSRIKKKVKIKREKGMKIGTRIRKEERKLMSLEKGYGVKN